MFTKFILIVIILFGKNCACKKYGNFTLYRGVPINKDHLDFFRNLSEMYDINFWRDPGNLYKPVEFVIGPDDQQNFLRTAEGKGIYFTTILKDVQSAFDMQTVNAYVRRQMDTFDWKSYFRIKDIYAWLRDLGKTYPREIQLQSIGKTYENRDIMSVKLVLRGCKFRSTVIIEGGIHAREWISPSVVTYLLYKLLTSSKSGDKALKNIALTYEWYFVPVLNPDGYEYTHTQDRLWRKNRHGSTYGVDLNRNFGIGFGTEGVSFNRHSEIYCGQHAFSELETVAMANFIRSKSSNLEYYIAFHSYGQYMILPYAHSKEHYDNFDEVKGMCKDTATAIARKYGTKYTIGTAYDTVGYLTSGVSGCWVKNTFKVPYVTTFELRDQGELGFALLPEKIRPTCEETLEGFKALLKPRQKAFEKLKISNLPQKYSSGTGVKVFRPFVVVCDIILFIIVRF